MCVQHKFGFPPDPEGAIFGPISLISVPPLTRGLDPIQSPTSASASPATPLCTGQIDADFEQESAILMQMTVKVFIKTA